jgi:hypothetical protein
MDDRVLNKVTRIWPDVDPREILEVLDGYEGKGRERAQLAVLKLSGGDRARLPELVRAAQRDWRDVVAAAENPESVRIGPSRRKRLPARLLDAIRRRDKRQHRKWLRR